MAKRSIIPKTHLIKSIRNRTSLSLDGALHEFCDNALGHGHCSTVYVTIGREQIDVRDDGIGADDVVRLFTLGDSSSYGNLSEIGQYGIGATDSAIFLGDDLRVVSARDGRVQECHVNWKDIEDLGEWEAESHERKLDERHLQDFQLGHGTKVTVSQLSHRWFAQSSVKLAEHLGLVFMPALRKQTRIHVTHMDREGVKFSEWIAPYAPPQLHDRQGISGAIETQHGLVRWRGTAGLSTELSAKENAVLIIFGHRVIERTDDPFIGRTAPTLYAEVELLRDTPSKKLLSDKKDRIIRYRDELMESIGRELAALIEKASQEGEHLVLEGIMLPIQEQLTRALQGTGVLLVDPDDEGEHGDGSRGKKGAGRLKPIREQGMPADPKPPTGVQVEWTTLAKLEGKPYDHKFSRFSVTVLLAREHYEGIIDWPPRQRDQRIIELIVAMVARGFEAEYHVGNSAVLNALKPKLKRRVETWADANEIAPRLQAELQARIVQQVGRQT